MKHMVTREKLQRQTEKQDEGPELEMYVECVINSQEANEARSK